MEVTCRHCGSVLRVPDDRLPVGRSLVQCPKCKRRLRVFVGVPVGAVLTNLTGVRFLAGTSDLMDKFCDPGETWRVVKVVDPCPDKGKGRPCELQNCGRCPNQRLVVRLSRDMSLYKTCLYRRGWRIFDTSSRSPVGSVSSPSSSGPKPLPSW